MPAIWYLRRDREEQRSMRRMMRTLPIRYTRVRSVAPPFPPLRVTPFYNSPAARESRESGATHRWEIALLIFLAVLIVLLTVLCAYGGSLAEEEDGKATQMYVTVASGSWLNGRYSPNRHSSVEARYQAGDTVDVYEVSGQWAKVKGGEFGYVWCDIRYLSDAAPGSDPEACTVISDGRVHVRETPGDGKTVRWLHNGDSVNVQFQLDGWAYVGDGYVLSRYLEAVQ